MLIQTSGLGSYSSGIGSCCAECAQKGMGAIDLSSFNWEDWALVGIVGAVLFSMGGKTSKRRRRKSHGFGAVEGILTATLVLGGGYLAYQYFQGSQGM